MNWEVGRTYEMNGGGTALVEAVTDRFVFGRLVHPDGHGQEARRWRLDGSYDEWYEPGYALTDREVGCGDGGRFRPGVYELEHLLCERGSGKTTSEGGLAISRLDRTGRGS